MNQGHFRTGHFEADGNAVNLDLGFVPDYIKIINTGAADTEVFMLEWFREFGDAKDIWHYKLNNDGGDDVDSPVKKASGGYVSAYDSAVIGNRKSVTFDYTGGAAEDLLTVAAGHGFVQNERVKLVGSGGLATGLNDRTIYFVHVLSVTTFKLMDAKDGDFVEFTSDGTAPNYVFSVDNLETNSDGGQGVTISASFMDNGDEIYYMAVKADRDVDHGDAAAF